MKLTTKQLRNIIKEELVYITEGRDIEDDESIRDDAPSLPDERNTERWGEEGDGYEMDQDAYDIYDQAIRLTYDRLARLIGHLEVYRDNPDSERGSSWFANKEAYDIYDQAVRLTYDQLSRLIGHLASYRDDPDSARTK